MKESIIIKNATIVNEGVLVNADVLIDNGIIKKIGNLSVEKLAKIIDGTGKYLFWV